MIKSVVALIALMSLSSMAPATGQAAGPVDTGQASQEPVKTTTPPQPGPATAAKDATQQGTPPAGEHLPAIAGPAKKESLKAAVNRAIKVFVPSEKIDVDKPVDFPTNI